MPVAPHPRRTPLLRNGDRLARVEFHRRYEAMPPEARAQLIEGVVHLRGRVSVTGRGRPHLVATGWLGRYLNHTPPLDLHGVGSTVLLDDANEPEPDVLLSLPPALGGRATVGEGDYVVGPPTLVVEIAAGRDPIELREKLDAYRRSGVAEYLVWRTDDAAVDLFLLRGDRYDRQSPGDDGLVRSEAFPGLWLDPAALIARDLPRLFAAIDAGCATPEHAAFVGRLAAAG